MNYEKLELVTLEAFKNEVELWRDKGFPKAVEARFEDGELVLVIPVYGDTSGEMIYCVSVPFNEDTFICLDKDYYDWKE